MLWPVILLGLVVSVVAGRSQLQPIQPMPTVPQGQSNIKRGRCSENSECVFFYECDIEHITADYRQSDTPYSYEDSTECTGILQTCCDVSNNIGEPVTKCGVRNLYGVAKHKTLGIKENQLQFGEFPWMTMVMHLQQDECVGSLIHPSVVLTTAHNIIKYPAEELTIRVGEWDLQSTYEDMPHQDVNVKSYSVHMDYRPGRMYNDVALLFLKEPVKIMPHVNTVCLPPPNHSFNDSMCMASGWGHDQLGMAEKMQPIPKLTVMRTLSHGECQRLLRHSLDINFQLHESFMCAGGVPGMDMCVGDGGSPLVCPVSHTIPNYYQAGIVSWGVGCNDGVPGVYTNVARYRHWIDSKMIQHDFGTTSYTL